MAAAGVPGSRASGSVLTPKPSGPGVKPAPSSARGQRTRAALLDGARRVFLESGYGAASVAAIAKAAEVGHGSFYVYFSTKQEIFAELADRVMDEIYAATRAPATITDPALRLEHENRRFFDLYRQHARMFTVIEEAVHVDASFARAWRAMRRRRVQRLVRAITRLQEQGGAEPSLDPSSLAVALGAMAERLAYLSTVDDGLDTEALLGTLNSLWQRALGVEVAAAPASPR